MRSHEILICFGVSKGYLVLCIILRREKRGLEFLRRREDIVWSFGEGLLRTWSVIAEKKMIWTGRSWFVERRRALAPPRERGERRREEKIYIYKAQRENKYVLHSHAEERAIYLERAPERERIYYTEIE